MKILFVINEIGYADHIAIAYLSGIAKNLGHSTYICILDYHNLFNMIENIRPEVVAYSVNIVGYNKIIEHHKVAMKKYNFISIMGGPQSTFFPETFCESEMDAYCIGEGDYAFRDFIKKVENNESFDFVENLITKNNRNGIRCLISNLDDLPKTDRDLTISNSFLRNIPKKTFYTTRGCQYNCSYCCNGFYNKLYRGKGRIVRKFSVDRIIDEIKDVKSKYRMEFVKFGDDIFVSKADDWLEEFSKKYSKEINLPFNCYLRFDIVNEDVLKLLKNANCYSAHLSVDSTSNYIRENILNRKTRNINIEEKLKLIRKYKINTWVNYMIGVPESTIENDLETIKMSKKGKVSYPHYSITDPMYGTKLFDYCVDKKIVDPSYRGIISTNKSVLNCFSEKEKDIQLNIMYLGGLISKLPFPLDRLLIWIIKIIPPNKIFKKIGEIFYNYNIKKVIFKLKK